MRHSNQWRFFAILPRADGPLAALWFGLLALRGLLPAGFAIAMGALVAAVQHSQPLGVPLAWVGGLFVLVQVLGPVQSACSANLGDRTAAWLYDRLTEACVEPPGIAHLEDAALTGDLTLARDFDLGMTGPPLAIAMDFIATGLVFMLAGLASAAVLFGYAWWAPLVLAGAWLSTHWLLRESGVWRDRNTDEVRSAQRAAEYAYRLAVDPPASKELRLFGLANWTLERFVACRTRLHELQYQATRLRERPMVWSLLLVSAANSLVFWYLAQDAVSGRLSLGAVVMFLQSALGASAIAFGGLSWALDVACAPVGAVLRLQPAMEPGGALVTGQRRPATGMPAREIRFRGLRFAYPNGGQPVLDGLGVEIVSEDDDAG
ncbi:MAG: ABC transporter ATP-binding protein, partial [Chloroflexi bacterium]|nr:ABC transporter ATP-binding protein [Chloroflexota bacterium]